MKEPSKVTSYILPPEEVEALLARNFGTRLQPVNTALLGKLRQQQQAVFPVRAHPTTR